MQALIDKLLDLARLEKRPDLENLEYITLKPMITDIVHSANARLFNQSITANIFIDEKLEVLGDTFLVKQAAFNLMDNALDFVHSNGTIDWRAEIEQEHIRLSIFNTGPNIPDYAMPRLTERFYSLARENGSKSTGLGLNFVEQIVKLHKGALHIENVKSGVKVTITLPTP